MIASRSLFFPHLRHALPIALIFWQASTFVLADYPITDFEYAHDISLRITHGILSSAKAVEATGRLQHALKQNRSGANVWPVFLCVEDDPNDRNSLLVFWADPNGAGDSVEITMADGTLYDVAVDERSRDLNRFRAMYDSNRLPCVYRINLDQLADAHRDRIAKDGVRVVLHKDNPLLTGQSHVSREIARFLDRCHWQNDLVKGTAQEDTEYIDIASLSDGFKKLRESDPKTVHLVASHCVPGPPPNPNIQLLWYAITNPVLQVAIETKQGDEGVFHIPPFHVADQERAIAQGFGLITRKVRTLFNEDACAVKDAVLSTSKNQGALPKDAAEEHAIRLIEELNTACRDDAPDYFLYIRVLDDPAQRELLIPQFAFCAKQLKGPKQVATPILCGYYSPGYYKPAKRLPVNIYWSDPAASIHKVIISTSRGGNRTVYVKPDDDAVQRYYADLAWQMNDLGVKLLFFTVDFSFDSDPGEILSIKVE